MAAIAAAGISAAASIFGSSKSANASKEAAQAQLEAARLQTLVARELHEHWKSNYRDCDIAAIREVCAEPKYTPQYALWEGRARLEVLRSFARARDVLRKCQDVYCVGRAAQQCNYIAGIEAVALVDAVNFGYRWEESQRIVLDQQRLSNLYRWLGLGRNLLDQSNNASAMASLAGGRLGAQAGQATNGWLQAAGWLTSPEGRKLLGTISEKLFPAGDTPAAQAARLQGYTSDAEAAARAGTPFTNPMGDPNATQFTTYQSPYYGDANTSGGTLGPFMGGGGTESPF